MPYLYADQYAATVARAAQINARAAKKGLAGRIDVEATPVTWWEFLSAAGPLARSYTEPDLAASMQEDDHHVPTPGMWAPVNGFKVTLGGQPPAYGDWELIAVLDSDEGGSGQLIVRTAPGVDSVDRTGLEAGWCSECRTRRHRKDTYVVRNTGTGEQRQVGSSCIKDFLGHDAKIAWLDVRSLGDIDEEFTARDPDEYMTVTVLAYALAATRAWGYVKSSEPNSTKEAVRSLLSGKLTAADRAALDQLRTAMGHLPITPEALRDWIRSDDFTGTSDYVLNLKALASAERCTGRNLGYLVSAPAAWLRAQNAAAERTEIPASEWVGQPKDKLTVTAEIISISWPPAYRQSYYSTEVQTDTRYVLRDTEGHLFVWRTGHSVLGDLRGVTVTITGTVKAHEEWKATKQTVLTRCKLAQPAAAAA